MVTSSLDGMRGRLLGAVGGFLLGLGALVTGQTPQNAPSPETPPSCVVSGRITSGGTPLPGVSLVAMRDGRLVAATSTDANGAYRLRVAPGDYRLTAELAVFTALDQPLVLAAGACATTLDLQLTLASRAPGVAPPAPAAAARSERGAIAGAGRRGGGPGGRGAAPAGDAQSVASRFAPLPLVQADTAEVAGDADFGDEPDPATRLLPPGFSTEASSSVVAVTGDAASVDRGQLRDRLSAIGRGEFELPAGIPAELADRIATFAQGGGFGGRGGGRGGGGGDQGNLAGLLGRGRGQNRLQGSANYTFGGSALDASPYPIRGSSRNDPSYARQNFGATIGGPLRVPGVINSERSTFFVNYSGGHSTNLVDQYASVPTPLMRTGDLSELGGAPVDPATGQPFPGGRIPADRVDPGSALLLNYFPLPNLPGTAQNYRRSDTSLNRSDNVSVRLTHTFGAAGRGGRGGRGGGGGGGFRGQGGAAGRSGTSATLNAQVQYRRSDSDSLNVFPELGGSNTSSTLSAPVTLNVLRGRTIHNVQVNVSRTSSGAANRFADVANVAGDAGIGGVSTDPAEWGLPSLSFTSVTGLRDLSPSDRSDQRLQIGYSSTRPSQRHAIRYGGDMRLDTSRSTNNNNARGTFVFTGLYSSSGPVVRGQGLDFADFLLGMPQQASVQYTDEIALKGRSYSLYLQDDWRARGSVTVNMGVRYELVKPYTEASGRMVNLDASPDFTAVAPVFSGGTGTFSGVFPDGLVTGDYNNVAPRVGVAMRLPGRVVLRGGYGTSFNNGSYAAIARQLVSQPPFAVTNTNIGGIDAPLSYTDPFATVADSAITNNFGVDRDYELGVIQTWNVDADRGIGGGWQIGGGYTGTQGTTLDMVRAPNRGPEGLRLEGVQPFLWQASEGRSILHSVTLRARRRQARGLSGNLSYTLAKSMDDASSIGGGGQVVAQDDQNLDAEWGLSSFDRRHQFDGSLSFELPFGPNRKWLYQGGVWSSLLQGWTLSANYSAQSGTPFTARTVGAASDVSRGTNGTLRADYTGAPVTINDPALLQYFNTTAFSVPLAGTFGSAGRNTIIGPAQQQLDASLSRDVRFGNRAVSVRLQGTNLFNSVRFGAIDTVVNSPTFGQVVSIRPMRSVQLNVRFRF
jgi:hypothetical protein